MTFTFLNKFVTLNFRNGFGFDIEACDSRPVFILEDDEILPSCFNGIIFLIPFAVVSIGTVFVLEDE